MPVTASLAKDSAIAGPLGGLLLSCARANSSMLVLRAIRWYRDLARLGIRLPLFVLHDVGLVFVAPPEQLDVGIRRGAEAVLGTSDRLSTAWQTYSEILGEIRASEIASRARTLRLSDDLMVVLLARMLGSLKGRVKEIAPYPATLPLDLELVREIDGQLPSMYASVPRAFELSVLEAFAQARLQILTHADAVDLDTLRLLGMLGPESSAAGALAHVDLLAAMGSPAANDIVNFSLELLPSVLETKRTQAVGTQAVGGYGGIGTKGSLDSLVLTELAWEKEEFIRRGLDQELLYYAREQAPEQSRRLHYIVIDASASMRGEREVFARGLAIALAKKLQLTGEEVWMRFFDSRLYEVQRPRPGQLPAAYVLGFRGERGRNPARVFAQLATELALLRARDQRDPVVHLVTHAALHVPRDIVTEVIRQAHLFGIFILPSGGALDLEYLDLLEGHAVVDHATLQQKSARAAAATKIVDEAAKVTERTSLPPQSMRAEPTEPSTSV